MFQITCPSIMMIHKLFHYNRLPTSFPNCWCVHTEAPAYRSQIVRVNLAIRSKLQIEPWI